MMRRLLIAAAVVAAAAVFAGPSAAARPIGWNHVVTSQHFVVHYTSDTNNDDYVTFTQASDVAADFEHAYAAEVGLGFTAPLDDGDGHIDVYLESIGPDVLGQAVPDNPGNTTSSGYIILAPAALADTMTVAHELFHLIQFATWVPTVQSDTWLFEGSAEWMGAKVDGFPAGDVSELGPTDMPLDCREDIVPSPPLQMCNPDFSIEGGYSRWPFFESLAQRYGVTFVQDVLARGATGLSATGALAAAIAARGGSLADVYNDWAVEQMRGTYGISALDSIAPTPYATIQTGVAGYDWRSLDVNVDHLATRYVKFTRGDGASDHACYVATLTLKVTVPAGVTSVPTFYWAANGSQPFSLTSGVETPITTWDTCTWSTAGYLALPNDTYAPAAMDTQDFHLEYKLDVTTIPASATAAPTQVPIYGGQTQVSTSDAAPSISVFGPLLLQVSASSPVLRLIVESTGDGALHAMLGSVDLGSPTVRAGNNDLRFTLPKTLLTRLRRSSSVANVLTLTPTSTSGSVVGTAVSRTVVVTAPKATKHKKKK
jgi:hypothetical protein